MSEYVIETNHLSKSGPHGDRVKNLHLAVPRGCVYGFLGPNGAGKTTTMKLLLGLIRPTGGQIQILGQTVTAKNRFALNRHTGSLIESPSLYGHLTGQENMEIIAKYKKVPQKQIKEVLEIVGLYERRNQKTKQYSLGMKQRLALAMALLGRPEILILDEPTNGLDPAGIQEIRELIKQMPDRFHTTVLVSSHLLSEIEQMSDIVGIIHRGSLIYQGPLSSLEKEGNNLEEVFLTLTEGGGSL